MRLAQTPFSKEPLPVRLHAEQHRFTRRLHAAIRHASVEQVPLADIRTVQATVDMGKVLGFSNTPGAVPTKDTPACDLPIVIDMDGRRYLHDGHHRASAAFILGHETIYARVAKM